MKRSNKKEIATAINSLTDIIDTDRYNLSEQDAVLEDMRSRLCKILEQENAQNSENIDSETVLQDSETGVTWTEIQYGMEALKILYDYYIDNDDRENADAINTVYYILEQFSKNTNWTRKQIA
ncbi:MAG: hypothetical protein RI531_04745 [Haloferacaceae archaeon]|nr:hypothetical protein [Haloferacaceae archaeon]